MITLFIYYYSQTLEQPLFLRNPEIRKEKTWTAGGSQSALCSNRILSWLYLQQGCVFNRCHVFSPFSHSCLHLPTSLWFTCLSVPRSPSSFQLSALRFISTAQQHGLLRKLPGGGGPGGRQWGRRGRVQDRKWYPLSRCRKQQPSLNLLLLPLNTLQGQAPSQAAAQWAW